MWAKIDRILSDCKDYHLPITLVIFIVGSVLDWYHHLNPDYVTFSGLVLGAITGHAFRNTNNNGD